MQHSRRSPQKNGNGQCFRALNIVDDYSRECVGQLIDTSIFGVRLCRYLDELAMHRPLPRTIVCDNGPEFTSKAAFFLVRYHRFEFAFYSTRQTDPEYLCGRFYGKFRDGRLNQYWFSDPVDAKRTIHGGRQHYNEVRPHSSPGYKPPAVFAREAV